MVKKSKKSLNVPTLENFHCKVINSTTLKLIINHHNDELRFGSLQIKRRVRRSKYPHTLTVTGANFREPEYMGLSSFGL